MLYNIETQVIEYHTVYIEADSEEEAFDKAYEEYYDTANAYRTEIDVVSVKEVKNGQLDVFRLW